MNKSLLSFVAIVAFSTIACLAQTNPLDSEHTQPIAIPITCGGFYSWEVKKVHMHKGDTLVAYVDHASTFEDRDNNSMLTSEIYYGDNSTSGYFDYLRGWAPPCITLSSHATEGGDVFSYTATMPGMAWIYFHWVEKEKGELKVHAWLDTCIEVTVD